MTSCSTHKIEGLVSAGFWWEGLVSAGFGSFQVVSAGFGSFRFLVITPICQYLNYRKTRQTHAMLPYLAPCKVSDYNTMFPMNACMQ